MRVGNGAAVAGFAVAVGAIVALVARRELLATTAPLIAVQACAVALMVWARLTFGLRSFHLAANTTEGGLIRSGPYRYWRHPIYAAVVYFVWAGVAAHRSWAAAGLAAAATLGLFARMLAEEGFLAARYPEYAAHAASTRRFVPGLF